MELDLSFLPIPNKALDCIVFKGILSSRAILSTISNPTWFTTISGLQHELDVRKGIEMDGWIHCAWCRSTCCPGCRGRRWARECTPPEHAPRDRGSKRGYGAASSAFSWRDVGHAVVGDWRWKGEGRRRGMEGEIWRASSPPSKTFALDLEWGLSS